MTQTEKMRIMGKLLCFIFHSNPLFYVEEVKTIENLGQYFGKDEAVGEDLYMAWFNYFIDDYMNVLFVNKEGSLKLNDGENWYERVKKAINFKTKVEEELIPQYFSNELYFGNECIVFLKSNILFYSRWSGNKIEDVVQININMKNQSTYITDVYLSLDSNYLIFVINSKDRIHYRAIVWDLEKNQEDSSHSAGSQQPNFIYGKNSVRGYLLCYDYYINLDDGIPNYFYECIFPSNSSIYKIDYGYKINKAEDIIIEGDKLYLKETLVETMSLDDYAMNKFKLNKENINLERIRYQVDKSTMLHYFALNFEMLWLILDYMEEHKPGYLNAILMKNKRGMSPLDIAIENESPKNTEIMLLKLLNFKDQRTSHVFFDRFQQLLDMNLKAFNLYLDTCTFKTFQMKDINYLSLKSNSRPFFTDYHTSLIDNQFIDENCMNVEKRVAELEKIIDQKKVTTCSNHIQFPLILPHNPNPLLMST